MAEAEIRVLFVCTGNICRSPTAEGVFRRLVAEAGLESRVVADSAGTISYHAGSPPDERSSEAARARGIDLGDLRARQVHGADFVEFDYVLAMDQENRRYLLDSCPPNLHHKIRLLLEFAPGQPLCDVPDPYYGGDAGFERVLDLIEAGVRGLLAHISEQHP